MESDRCPFHPLPLSRSGLLHSLRFPPRSILQQRDIDRLPRYPHIPDRAAPDEHILDAAEVW